MNRISRVLISLTAVVGLSGIPVEAKGLNLEHTLSVESNKHGVTEATIAIENTIFSKDSLLTLETPMYQLAKVDAPEKMNMLEYAQAIKNNKSVVYTDKENSQEVKPEDTYYTVNVSALNKRKSTDMSKDPIGIYYEGQPLKGIPEDEFWVKLDNGSYVALKYLKELKVDEEEYLTAVEEFEAHLAKLAEDQRQREAEQQRAAEQRAQQEQQKRQEVAQQPSHKSTSKQQSTSAGRNGISITSSERELLARLVRAEAGGESYEGMVAVASVVFNRLLDPAFPNSIEGIIYATNQFSPVTDGSINKAATDIQYKAVDDALTRDNVNGAVFFYAPSLVQSSYMESLPTVAVIGSHQFKAHR